MLNLALQTFTPYRTAFDGLDRGHVNPCWRCGADAGAEHMQVMTRERDRRERVADQSGQFTKYHSSHAGGGQYATLSAAKDREETPESNTSDLQAKALSILFPTSNPVTPKKGALS